MSLWNHKQQNNRGVSVAKVDHGQPKLVMLVTLQGNIKILCRSVFVFYTYARLVEDKVSRFSLSGFPLLVSLFSPPLATEKPFTIMGTNHQAHIAKDMCSII